MGRYHLRHFQERGIMPVAIFAAYAPLLTCHRARRGARKVWRLDAFHMALAPAKPAAIILYQAIERVNAWRCFRIACWPDWPTRVPYALIIHKIYMSCAWQRVAIIGVKNSGLYHGEHPAIPCPVWRQ